MRKELENKLFNDFPNLYRQHNLPKRETCMSYGFTCGDGWFDIIYNLSRKISEIDSTIEAIQVKEKFGGLRFYLTPIKEANYKEICDVINEAESEASKTCEKCGSKENVLLRKGSWLRTLCDKCEKEKG
jgi:hypothetical protein